MARTKRAGAPDPHTGPSYPGLGLPLRTELDDDWYPIGAHGSCPNSHTDLIPVRELAMLHIMDRLSDKPNWHEKVWDEDIVAKWRAEAKAIPDIEHWYLATRGKTSMRYEQEEENERVRAEENGEDFDPWGYDECQMEGIIDDNTFDCVSYFDQRQR